MTPGVYLYTVLRYFFKDPEPEALKKLNAKRASPQCIQPVTLITCLFPARLLIPDTKIHQVTSEESPQSRV